MKYRFCFLLALVFTINSYSQLSDSLLNKYMNQDLKLNQLTISGNIYGNNENGEFLFNGNSSINYYQFVNLNKIQTDFSARLGGQHVRDRSYFYFGTTTGFSNPLSTRSSFDFNLTSLSRYYPKNKLFYGLAYRIHINFDHDNVNDFGTIERTEKTKSQNYNLVIPLSIGKGRKYPVFSVHRSLWIYSELLKRNSLKRIPDEIDVETLAHLIDQNIYTRFFDSRYKRILDLSRIDSLLSSQNILSDKDINYFTTLYDMYYYSLGENRFRGNLLEGGVSGYFNYNKSKIRISTDTTIQNLVSEEKAMVPVFFVQYQSYRPIDLHWQLDYGFLAEYGLNSLIRDQNNRSFPIDNVLSLEGRAVLYYFPNTRSYLSIGCLARYGNHSYEFYNLNYFHNIYFSNISFDNRRFEFLTGYPYYLNYNNSKEGLFTRMEINHYYYISPQFKVHSDLNLNYQNNNSLSKNDKKLRAQFNIAIIYDLF